MHMCCQARGLVEQFDEDVQEVRCAQLNTVEQPHLGSRTPPSAYQRALGEGPLAMSVDTVVEQGGMIHPVDDRLADFEGKARFPVIIFVPSHSHHTKTGT